MSDKLQKSFRRKQATSLVETPGVRKPSACGPAPGPYHSATVPGERSQSMAAASHFPLATSQLALMLPHTTCHPQVLPSANKRQSIQVCSLKPLFVALTSSLFIALCIPAAAHPHSSRGNASDGRVAVHASPGTQSFFGRQNWLSHHSCEGAKHGVR